MFFAIVLFIVRRRLRTEVIRLSRFDFGQIRDKAKELFSSEVEISRGIQDEVKRYNERYPKWMEPLHKMVMEGRGNIGEFSEGQMTGDTYEEQAWSYFLGKGFNKKAIAGVMGNLQQESGINPTTIQGNGKGPGTGLVQWGDGMDGGRWNALEKWAKAEGKDKWDMQTQLDYLWLEMTNGSHDTYWRRAGEAVGIDLSGTKEEPVKKFGAIDNIEKAMIAFELTIERAGIKHNETRIKYAKGFYEKYKDWDPNMVTVSSSSGKFLPPHRDEWYSVTSEFGWRIHPIHGTKRLHGGIDLSSGKNTQLYTAGAGKVEHKETNYGNTGWGNYIVINHGKVGNKTLYSLYAHMKDPSPLSVGQTIGDNTKIGFEGTTGSSTGNHLHLEFIEAKSGQTWGNGEKVNARNYITFK